MFLFLVFFRFLFATSATSCEISVNFTRHITDSTANPYGLHWVAYDQCRFAPAVKDYCKEHKLKPRLRPTKRGGGSVV